MYFTLMKRRLEDAYSLNAIKFANINTTTQREMNEVNEIIPSGRTRNKQAPSTFWASICDGDFLLLICLPHLKISPGNVYKILNKFSGWLHLR